MVFAGAILLVTSTHIVARAAEKTRAAVVDVPLSFGSIGVMARRSFRGTGIVTERYGQMRKGHVALIYVTEPMNRRTWIKDDAARARRSRQCDEAECASDLPHGHLPLFGDDEYLLAGPQAAGTRVVGVP